ncbi:MAG: hypothetical protein NTW19_13640 [Planctomycetota bacterium]|nr:hypothetical protein [Planctomycetota bacterium]
MLKRLDALGRRAAIVGPKGTGKSTLLEDLAQRFVQRGLRPRIVRVPDPRERFDSGSRRVRLADLVPRDLGPGDVLLVDSAENLNWLAWRSALTRARPAAGMVITAHRPGRLPTLIETRTSPQLLREIVDQLLAGSPALREKVDVDSLFAEHRGNLHEALRELYLRWAEQ